MHACANLGGALACSALVSGCEQRLEQDPITPLLAVLLIAAGWVILRLLRTLGRVRSASEARERAHREVRQNLQELLDNAPAAIWRVDSRGRLVMANQKLCSALGRPEAELASLARFYDAFEPALAARMAGRDAQALLSPVAINGQDIRRLPDGSQQVLDVVKARVLNEHGLPEGVVSIATDVTRQRESEEQLRQRFELEQELLSISKDLVSDQEAAIEAAINRALALLGGFTKADRSYLFLVRESGQRVDNTHEWCAPGVEPQIQYLQDCDVESTWPWATSRLREGLAVEVADTGELPPEATLDRASMAEQDIQSILLLPIRRQDTLVAFVGLDSTRTRTRWRQAERSLLQLVGELLSQSLLRTRAEAQRRQAHAELDALFSALPDLIFVVDRAQRFISFKGGASDRLLAPPEAFLGRRFEEVLPAELAAAAGRLLADCLDGRACAALGYELPLESGISDFELRMVRLAEHSAMAIIRDVSDMRRSQRALDASEARFRGLLEGLSHVAVQSCGQDLRVRFWNAGSESLYGIRHADALGRDLVDLIVPKPQRQTVTDMAKSWFAGGELPGPTELHLQSGNGEPRIVLSNQVVQRTSEGDPELFRIDIDLSELKRAQEDLQLIASVFTHTQDGVMITDRSGRILRVNESFCRITGYSTREAIGQTPALLRSGLQDASFYADFWARLRKEGHWAGEVWNRRRDGSLYAEYLKISSVRDRSGRILRYVAVFSDITAQKEYQGRLEHMAHFDGLTDLPNRSLMAERIRCAMADAERGGVKLALAYIDLDDFKTLNDRHGHAMGDRLLCEIADRLRLVLGDGESAARIGGDEFALLLVDTTDDAGGRDRLARIASLLQEPVAIEGCMLQVSASIGVSLFPQLRQLDADQLLRQADQAMYVVKHGGKGGVEFFDLALDQQNRDRQRLLERIEQALTAGELELYYQPKVNLLTDSVLGFEALIRWNHPERGLLGPGEFLQACEGHAVAFAIGDWVLSCALGELRRLHAAGHPVGISVNLSPSQLLAPGFTSRLHALLESLQPGERQALVLEVLESSVLDDLDQASAVLGACRALGVEFSMDDFGTGYSSLAYLRHLPFSELKIDRSFVRDVLIDPEDRAIIEGIVALARTFRLRLVAEGVETREQAEALVAIGCCNVQGFGISRPMPASMMQDWLERHPSGFLANPALWDAALATHEAPGPGDSG